jgi:hypothetical protein
MTSNEQEALRNFRWARGGATDDSPATESQSAWSRWTSLAGSYVPLRSDEHTNEEEAYFALSRWERCVFTPDCALARLFINTFPLDLT